MVDHAGEEIADQAAEASTDSRIACRRSPRIVRISSATSGSCCHRHTVDRLTPSSSATSRQVPRRAADRSRVADSVAAGCERRSSGVRSRLLKIYQAGGALAHLEQTDPIHMFQRAPTGRENPMKSSTFKDNPPAPAGGGRRGRRWIRRVRRGPRGCSRPGRRTSRGRRGTSGRRPGR